MTTTYDETPGVTEVRFKAEDLVDGVDVGPVIVIVNGERATLDGWKSRIEAERFAAELNLPLAEG